MKRGAAKSFGAQLEALRETAGFTQEELATIAGLSVSAVSALERGERRPHVETVRALSAALIDSSLVLRAETSVAARSLYQMLETVRAYAALALTAAGEREDAIEGLVRSCSHEASLASEALVGPAQAEWLGRVRDDVENAWAARVLGAGDAVTERIGATVVDTSVQDIRTSTATGEAGQLGWSWSSVLS